MELIYTCDCGWSMIYNNDLSKVKMKKFKVKITDKKTNQILEDIEVLSNGEKYLKNIYSSKYKFHSNKVAIEITRMKREPGKQIDLEEMIKDIENESNSQS